MIHHPECATASRFGVIALAPQLDTLAAATAGTTSTDEEDGEQAGGPWLEEEQPCPGPVEPATCNWGEASN